MVQSRRWGKNRNPFKTVGCPSCSILRELPTVRKAFHVKTGSWFSVYRTYQDRLGVDIVPKWDVHIYIYIYIYIHMYMISFNYTKPLSVNCGA